MIEILQKAEQDLPNLLLHPDLWKTLDVDYFPPRVERLWLQYDEKHRLFIHYIHPTGAPCLFHKHKWPAAFKMLKGSYELGFSFSEPEVSSTEAYGLPLVSKVILTAGSYYEMTHTHAMHYVKPLNVPSLSLMITGTPYSEKRSDINPPLYPLNAQRKEELIKLTSEVLVGN